MGTLNIKEILETKYGNKFEFHDEFYKEFVDLVEKSGAAAQIINQLMRRLDMILQLDNIDRGLPWLEKLKGYENIYSLHIDEGKTNYRLLFSKNKSGKIFLRMFYERKGKEATSYKKNILIALERFNTINFGGR